MKNPSVEIGVQLTDVFTQSLCSDIIVEIVKFIIYEKQLIPYPLDQLKLVVSRRRSLEGSSNDQTSSIGNPGSSSFILEKKLKKTVDSLDILDNIFKSIISEIESCDSNDLKEVCLILGATILSPQNVFRIKVPRIEKGHFEKHHPSRKQRFNVLRSLLTSNFADMMCQEISSKNLYVFLKLNSSYSVKSNFLLPKDNFSLPSRGQQSVINIISSDKSLSDCCCSGIKVFNDANSEATSANTSHDSLDELLDISEKSDDEPSLWYQFESPFVGFKGNGESINNLWLGS